MFTAPFDAEEATSVPIYNLYNILNYIKLIDGEASGERQYIPLEQYLMPWSRRYNALGVLVHGQAGDIAHLGKHGEHFFRRILLQNIACIRVD